MKLRAIRLHNVRRFADEGIAIEGIDDGVNVLAAANEYGKSTVFDAIHALFFQGHKGKPKPILSLQPYSKGSITVEAEVDTSDGAYRIRKRWLGSVQSQVFDSASGRIVTRRTNGSTIGLGEGRLARLDCCGCSKALSRWGRAQGRVLMPKSLRAKMC